VRRVFETILIIDLYTVIYSQQSRTGKSQISGVFRDTFLDHKGIVQLGKYSRNLWSVGRQGRYLKQRPGSCRLHDLQTLELGKELCVLTERIGLCQGQRHGMLLLEAGGANVSSMQYAFLFYGSGTVTNPALTFVFTFWTRPSVSLCWVYSSLALTFLFTFING